MRSIGLYLAALPVSLIAAGSSAASLGAPHDAPPGWKLTAAEPGKACVADGPVSGPATLSIAAEGKMLLLIISAPEFPAAHQSLVISLQIDDDPPEDVNIMAGDGTYGLPLAKDLVDRLIAARQVVAKTASTTYSFTLSNVGPAIDATLKCAGQPTRAEIAASMPEPIAPGSPWTIHVPIGTTNCSLRRGGGDIDTIVILNRTGQVILGGGNPGWASWGGRTQISIQIDDHAEQPIMADAFANIFLAAITDPALLAELPDGKDLRWSTPNATYHVMIDGFGAALAALQACEKSHADAGVH